MELNYIEFVIGMIFVMYFFRQAATAIPHAGWLPPKFSIKNNLSGYKNVHKNSVTHKHYCYNKIVAHKTQDQNLTPNNNFSLIKS